MVLQHVVVGVCRQKVERKTREYGVERALARLRE